MKKIRQFATVVFLFVIIVLIGILAKNQLGGIEVSDVETPIRLSQTDEKSLKKANYIAALPHFGPLIHTESLDVTYQDKQAIGTIQNPEKTKIKTAQKVALYNQNNEILPLGGKVETIENNQVTISLPNDTDTSLLSKTVNVITLKTIGSKRIPLSALLKNEEGQNYVWVAKEPEEKQKKWPVRKNIITSTLQDKNYLDAGLSLNAMDWVILNPNENLEEDKQYYIAETILDAPLHDPVRQAWGEFELRRLEKLQAKLIQNYLDCINGVKTVGDNISEGSATLADGSTASSCSASQEVLNDPVAIFNSLIQTIESGGDVSVSGSSCGGSSCGGGSSCSSCGQ